MSCPSTTQHNQIGARHDRQRQLMDTSQHFVSLTMNGWSSSSLLPERNLLVGHERLDSLTAWRNCMPGVWCGCMSLPAFLSVWFVYHLSFLFFWECLFKKPFVVFLMPALYLNPSWLSCILVCCSFNQIKPINNCLWFLLLVKELLASLPFLATTALFSPKWQTNLRDLECVIVAHSSNHCASVGRLTTSCSWLHTIVLSNVMCKHWLTIGQL